MRPIQPSSLPVVRPESDPLARLIILARHAARQAVEHARLTLGLRLDYETLYDAGLQNLIRVGRELKPETGDTSAEAAQMLAAEQGITEAIRLEAARQTRVLIAEEVRLATGLTSVEYARLTEGDRPITVVSLDQLLREECPHGASLLGQIVDPEDLSARDSLERMELHQHLAAGMTQLSDTSRRIMELCYLDQMPLATVAAQLGLSEAEAVARRHAALATLQAQMREVRDC